MVTIFAFIFSLNVNAQLAPDEIVVVTPGIDKQGARRVVAPGSHHRADQPEILERAPRTLEEALGDTPGVEFTGGPRDQAQIPQIRGLDAGRILILEEGVRQNFTSGHNGRVFGDFSLTERVEVVKGPWSSLYGSGAMGGVISFARSTAGDLVARAGRDRGVEVALDAQSAASALGERVTAFGKFGRFEPLASVRHSNAHDVRLGNGEALEYSGGMTDDVYSSMAYLFDSAQKVTLKLNHYVDRADVPLDPAQELGGTNLLGASRITKRDAILDYSLARDGFDLHVKPFVRETKIEKTRLSDGRIDTQEVLTAGFDMWRNDRYQAVGGELVNTWGVDFFRDVNEGDRNGGKLDSFPDGTSQQFGLYVQPTMSWGRLKFAPGARFDSYVLEDSTGVSVNNREENASLKAYLTYEYRAGSNVFAGWGQAFNAPRLQDLYASGMHFPGNFFRPNPDLKPERSDTYEIGSKNRFTIGEDQAGFANLTYFRTEARDFIERQVDIPGGTTIFANVDRVRFEGFEAAVGYTWQRLGAALSYAQTRSLDKNTGEPLATTMADQWMGTLSFTASDDLNVGTSARHSAEQERVPAGVQPTGGYFVEDFFFTFRRQRLTLTGRVNNAFDRSYRRHTTAIDDPGRDFRTEIAWVF